MFKIKSQIEITREEDSLIKNTGYNPTAGSYICPFCKTIIYSSDFINQVDTEEMIDELIMKKGIELNQYSVFQEMNCISFIRRFSNECSKCNFPIDADIIFFIKKTSSNWEIEYEICDSKSLEFFFNSFLSLGIDIYSILPKLFLRWWKKNYQIDIVVPFINSEYVELFEETGKYFLCYEKNISDNKLPLQRNPFRKIVFRKIQSRFRGKEQTLENVIDDYYKHKFEKYGDDFFYMNPDGVDMITNSIFQVVNNIKENVSDSLSHKYSVNFHAKFIAGISDKTTELYLMSYNFGDIESLQFETHFLINVDTDRYLNDMKIFMEYHRLQIEKFRK